METMETMELTPDLFEPLDSAEKNSEFIAAEPRTYLSDAWHRFRKNKLALCGLVFLVIMVILAIVVPMVSPYTYDGMDYSSVNLLPCLEHPMGTDKFGRDILVRVMYGARISLMIGFSSALICLVIGVVYGGFSGYIGGKTDMILMRIVDILYAIPNLLLVILIMLVFGSNVTSIMIGICLTSWIGMARFIRNQIIIIRDREYNLASRCLGTPVYRIILRNLLPYLVSVVMLRMALSIPSAIGSEVFITYIGLGLSVETPSLGNLVNDGRKVMMQAGLRYQLLYPTLILSFVTIAFYLIGNAFSDAADPKNHLQ